MRTSYKSWKVISNKKLKNKTKESRQVHKMILGKLPKYMKLTKYYRFTMSTSTMSTRAH